MVLNKHYLKSYVAEFVFSEIDKMLASSYFFIVDYKTQRKKKLHFVASVYLGNSSFKNSVKSE